MLVNSDQETTLLSLVVVLRRIIKGLRCVTSVRFFIMSPFLQWPTLCKAFQLGTSPIKFKCVSIVSEMTSTGSPTYLLTFLSGAGEKYEL